jgi:DNA-binding transcriptional MerR regulator
MEKSDHAFRTISEAADAIGVPQHVLRFWETRFPQLQPLKRGGNRRYYRPADMALLATIRSMLHDQGLTIRGAKLLMEGAAEPPRKVRKSTAGDDATAPEAAPALAATVPPGIDRVLLRTIRDRLRYALSA